MSGILIAKGLATKALALICFVVMKCLSVGAPKLHIQVMTTNHQFFGHLLLEPEKFLNAREAQTDLYEIDFVGSKGWQNIGIGSRGSVANRTMTLWSFGRKSLAPNRQLLTMWKRKLHCVPGFVSGMLVRSRKMGKLPNVSEYVFSSLLSADRDFDSTQPHLQFSEIERTSALRDAQAAQIDLEKPFVCLIVRNETDQSSNSELRSRLISDFIESVQLLADSGMQVVRMGALKSPTLDVDHPLVIDYANSGKRTELLDLYLLSQCAFAVSTLSGPDGGCLAFRRPVLYVDLANYALCFSGTSLTTWTPARIINDATMKKLSVHEVFECGAGWFWKDSQFADAGLHVERSSAGEIAEFVSEMLEKWRAKDVLLGTTDSLQDGYRKEFALAMGELGRQWHGQVRSQMSESFLREHADWFLGR